MLCTVPAAREYRLTINLVSDRLVPFPYERIRKRRRVDQRLPGSLKQGHRECTKPKVGYGFVAMRGTEMLT